MPNTTEKRADLRKLHETILLRAEHLDEEQRLLVRAIIERGFSATEVARLRGASPRTIQNQFQQIARRLADPVVGVLVHGCEHWDPLIRKVAQAQYIRGCTLRQSADELGITLHQVRCARQIAKALLGKAGRKVA